MLEVSCLVPCMGDARLRQAPWALLFFLPHFMGCVEFFSPSAFASKKGLGVMGVGWIAPALLCEGKGSIHRKDVGCLLAACMTPEIPKQYAGHRQHNGSTVLPSAEQS